MLLNSLIGNQYPTCSSTNSTATARQLFQETIPYTKIRLVNGGYKYMWDERFIDKVVSTLGTGEYPSTSAKELKVLEEYLAYVEDGYVVGVTQDYILALDTRLGEIND